MALAVLLVGFVSQARAEHGAFPQRSGSVELLQRAGLIRIDGAAAGDNAGVSVARAGDVNGDGRVDVLVGAHFADNNSRADSGSAYVVFGRATPGTVDLARLAQAGFRIDGAAAGDFAGWSVAGAGDLNGDGRGDVLVGARGADNNGRAGSGSAYVVFGRAAPGIVDLATLGEASLRIDGAAAGDEAGGSVADAGDLNGDGRPDLLVGARLAGNNGREFSGSAYVVYGRAAPGTVDLATLGLEGFRIDGAAADDLAAHSVAGAGDVNGDGRADVLVGTRYAGNNARQFSGSAYVVFGKAAPGTVDLATLGQDGFRIDGAAAGDLAAGSVAGAGDLNADGRADVLVGARGADNNGRAGSGSAYAVFGRAAPGTVDLATLGQDGFRIDGAAASDRAGYSLAGASDLNGDRHADVLVGAHYARNNARRFSGSAYVVFGKVAPPATVDLATLGRSGFRIDGAAAGDGAGWSVAGAGDVNGDGRADVLAGAPDADNNGRDASGSAYVVFGRASPGTIQLDMTAPRLALSVRSPQRALGQRGVIVRASCDEPCRLSASGTIAILGQETQLRLRPASGRLGRPGRRMLHLALPRAWTRQLARFLERGKRARATVTVRARDPAGNGSTARRTAAVGR